MRSAPEILRLCGIAILFGGIAAALALILVPLGLQRTPAVTGQLVATGWCGPGLTSDSALRVRLDPGIVNTGPGAGQVSVAAQQHLERFCTGEANTRFTQAAITGGLALVIGLPLLLRRRDSTAYQPPAQGLPSWTPGPPPEYPAR